MIPWSVLSEYLSAQSQPNKAPFSLPGWPLMRAAHSTCSNFQWTLTLALCLSLAVSTFLGFWGSRDMLGPSFSHLPFTFSASAFVPVTMPRLLQASIFRPHLLSCQQSYVCITLALCWILPLPLRYLKLVPCFWSVCLLLSISALIRGFIIFCLNFCNIFTLKQNMS